MIAGLLRHAWYEREEVIAAHAGPAGLIDLGCGFFRSGDVIVAMIEFGDSSRTSHLSLPERVELRGMREGLAEDVRATGAPIHTFLRLAPEGPYFHAGVARVLGYGVEDASSEATLELEERLPEPAWMELGGYAAWSVEIDHEVRELEDAVELEGLLETFGTREFAHATVTRFRGESLTLHVNARRGWLMYLRESGDAGRCVYDVDREGEPNEHFRCGCGIELEFEATQTLERARAQRVIVEFVRTGVLPADLIWLDA